MKTSLMSRDGVMMTIIVMTIDIQKKCVNRTENSHFQESVV